MISGSLLSVDEDPVSGSNDDCVYYCGTQTCVVGCSCLKCVCVGGSPSTESSDSSFHVTDSNDMPDEEPWNGESKHRPKRRSRPLPPSSLKQPVLKFSVSAILGGDGSEAGRCIGGSPDSSHRPFNPSK